MELPVVSLGERYFFEHSIAVATGSGSTWSTPRFPRPMILRAWSFTIEGDVSEARDIAIVAAWKDVAAPLVADFDGAQRILPFPFGASPQDKFTADPELAARWTPASLRLPALPGRIIFWASGSLTVTPQLTTRLILDVQETEHIRHGRR